MTFKSLSNCKISPNSRVSKKYEQKAPQIQGTTTDKRDENPSTKPQTNFPLPTRRQPADLLPQPAPVTHTLVPSRTQRSQFNPVLQARRASEAITTRREEESKAEKNGREREWAKADAAKYPYCAI